ncbi:hypothetical protein NBRC116601_33530 [Cognatishimia sp. WU-CL00825]|uniref:DUF2793 domain-containing protein n=1 Tax=Cognatishimia sp. WU-CL00825 TaxID=3127658 RepID=UPI00310C0BDD
MPETSPRLALPFIQPAQAQKHVTHNTALEVLDALVQPVVLDRDRTQPPAAPTAGAGHLVAVGAVGAWASQDNSIAVWQGTGWLFLPPQEGWRVFVQNEGLQLVFAAGSWAAPRDRFDQLGVNATASAADRLAVGAAGSLFTHAGSDHRMRLNKATATDTASLVFQSNWSGRAELGLAGNEDLAIKISPDGSVWTEALRFDATTAHVSGAAVQQDSADFSAGRLMRADWGYGPGNILGPVSENAGVPTGALLESGSNANGSYLRFADGTQICAGEYTAAAVDITVGFAGGYRSDSGATRLFATGFSAPPRLTLSGGDLGTADALPIGHAALTATGFTPRFWRAASATVDVATDYMAIGRWF